MTETCSPGTGRRPGVALDLQGGGAHGAYTWRVLDRLLEDGLRVGAVCGVSSGAILGTLLVQGLVRGGNAGARREMRRLRRRVANARQLSPLQNGPLERWLFGWDLSNSLLWRGWEMAMRLFSPAQLNPFGHNPLRHLLDDLLDPALLTHPDAPRLTVAATDVETGEGMLFDNASVTVEVLVASACLPFVFPAVRIGDRAYWDGGYAGNPPLGPLLTPTPPDELVLIRAQPGRRPGVPTTPMEIMNRLSEIACHNVLTAELAALPPSVHLTSYDADAALLDLPISSKFNGEAAFLSELFEAGRTAVATHRPAAHPTTCSAGRPGPHPSQHRAPRRAQHLTPNPAPHSTANPTTDCIANPTTLPRPHSTANPTTHSIANPTSHPTPHSTANPTAHSALQRTPHAAPHPTPDPARRPAQRAAADSAV